MATWQMIDHFIPLGSSSIWYSTYLGNGIWVKIISNVSSEIDFSSCHQVQNIVLSTTTMLSQYHDHHDITLIAYSIRATEAQHNSEVILMKDIPHIMWASYVMSIVKYVL